jgi:hypothetical protein
MEPLVTVAIPGSAAPKFGSITELTPENMILASQFPPAAEAGIESVTV